MSLRNNILSYGSVAKFFHWAVAFLIIGMIAVGLIMANMENSPDRFKLIALHKEFGVVVLILACMRLGWKILDVSPLFPESMDKISRLGAKLVHSMLYILMFAMPITGWLMSSAAGFQVSFFGLFLLPNIASADKEFGHSMAELHEILAWILIALITLHVLAALLHHFYYKDNILLRMLPNFKGKSNAENTGTDTGI